MEEEEGGEERKEEGFERFLMRAWKRGAESLALGESRTGKEGRRRLPVLFRRGRM